MITTRIKRAVIEMSSIMTNNDEYYVHYIDEKSLEKWMDKFKYEPFYNPRIVCQRHVLDEEITEGLGKLIQNRQVYNTEDVHKNPDLFPQITYFLDDAAKIIQRITNKKDFIKFAEAEHLTPSWIMANIISTDYYDCLSGGVGQYYLAMCRWIIEKFKLDLNEKVYPGKDDEKDEWYNLQDFLNAIKDIPRLNTNQISTVSVLMLDSGNIFEGN